MDHIAALPKDADKLHRKSLEEWRDWFKRLMTAVGDARRTVRWFSSLGIVIALKKLAETGACAWADNKLAFAASQLALLWWHAGDHYRWLVMNKLVHSTMPQAELSALSLRLKNVSFTGFVIASAIQSVYFAQKLINPPPALLADKDKEHETQRSLIKSVLTLVATLHISELYMTHEVVCGLAGAATSAIVIYETFPRQQKKKEG